MSKIGGVFKATVYKIETKKDGSGRITFDFGPDSIDDIHFIQQHHMKKDCLFEIAAVPLANLAGEREIGWPPEIDDEPL